jgi:butyryl-CoA dehydrogenase
MLAHSADYLELASTTVLGWVWTKLDLAAQPHGDDFAKGLAAARKYWFATELSRVPALAALCTGEDRSYLDLPQECLG